ncbi:MAG: glycerophosphodiester phosphodiesterase [Actinobacteria bacterium]|nr:glycerophosphodiester phosphodiesterase [Actinomycetota bacterium]
MWRLRTGTKIPVTTHPARWPLRPWTCWPTVAVGWLLDWRAPVLENARKASELGLQAIHPHFLTVDQAVMDQAHAWGLAVNVWTVNKTEDINTMLDMGADTIITDDPALGLQELAKRS